jgi:hypothetical protein
VSRRRRPFRPRGIVTLYAGVRFRSRLEARYAAWFDAVGIGWEYEPALDQAEEGGLRGWLPDFVLDLASGPALAECKPALRVDDFQPAMTKAEASGVTGSVLLLGARWLKTTGSPLCVRAAFDGTAPIRWLPHVVATGQPALLELAWKTAGNKTQWRKR